MNIRVVLGLGAALLLAIWMWADSGFRTSTVSLLAPASWMSK